MGCFNKKRSLLAILLVAFCLFSCNVTKHLKTDQGERFLSKNSLKIKSEERLALGNRVALNYSMDGLYRQKPNRKFLGVFPMRLKSYYRHNSPSDTSKLDNFFKKRFAEEPVIFDEDKCGITAKNIQNFMRKKGYFGASCSYALKPKGQYYMDVEYALDLGPLYTIGQIDWVSKDSTMQAIMQASRDESGLRPGAAVDNGAFDAEKLRLTTLLRNQGYALFSPNYVEYNGDSVGTRVNLTVDILQYGDRPTHPRFTIGAVSVFSSLVPDVNTIRSDTFYRNIQYFSNEPKFFVKPKHLDRVIRVRPGQQYRLENLEKTNRGMSTMGAFRFVSVRPKPDSLRKDTMNIDIFYAPDKKMSIGTTQDLRYIGNPGLLGIPLSVYLKHRNLFRGAELLQTSLTGNVEFNVANSGSPIYQLEGKFQNDLTIPRFVDYLGLWRLGNHMRFGKKSLVSNRLYRRMSNDARAHVGLNASYLRFSDFFDSYLINGRFGYELTSKQQSISINHIGIDLLQYTRINSTFRRLIERNPLFGLSISDQLFTGFLLRGFNYSFYSKPNKANERYSFRLGADVSGWEVQLLNRLFDKDKVWNLNSVDFAKYARLEIGGSYSRSYSKDVWFGVNISSGVVNPFGDSKKSPYVKQFFVGGPSSIRAWNIRQLGPGKSYSVANDTITPYFQASDFKFEFSSELRFPMFWYFKGAVFIDGGNVWSLNRIPSQLSSALGWYSFQNIAIGTGFGLRLDFDYSVIRFDVGLKVRKPYLLNDEDRGGYWMDWRQGNFKDFRREIMNLNIAVGYPF